MLLTCYAPLRRSPTSIATLAAPRLACVKPAASVHPEPGSNSSLYKFYYLFVASEPDTRFEVVSKKLTFRSNFVTNSVLACTFVFQYYQRTSIPFEETGCKYRDIFLIGQKNAQKRLIFYFFVIHILYKLFGGISITL